MDLWNGIHMERGVCRKKITTHVQTNVVQRTVCASLWNQITKENAHRMKEENYGMAL